MDKYQGLVERGELFDDGYINKDHHLSPIMGVGSCGERVWIATKSDGTFLVYSDIGNGWCHVMYISTDVHKELR